MSKDDHWLIALLLFVAVMLAVHRIDMSDRSVIIDCNVNDPDYPPEVKESCRIKRMNDEQNKKIPTYYT
jgi:hypothetical protein